MVGFIEPVGTSFQSANEERTEKSTTAIINKGRTSSRQSFRARDFRVARFIGSLTQVRGEAFKDVRSLDWARLGQNLCDYFFVEFEVGQQRIALPAHNSLRVKDEHMRDALDF